MLSTKVSRDIYSCSIHTILVAYDDGGELEQGVGLRMKRGGRPPAEELAHLTVGVGQEEGEAGGEAEANQQRGRGWKRHGWTLSTA